MFNWYDVLVHQERCKDMMQEAGQYRFMRQVLAGLTRRERFHCRALRWLGRRLVAWGVRLQERYGAVATARNLEWCAVPQGSGRQ